MDAAVAGRVAASCDVRSGQALPRWPLLAWPKGQAAQPAAPARPRYQGLVIDCHGHYTTEPPAMLAWRKRQIDAINDPS